MHKIVLIHFGKLKGLVRGNIYNNLTHEARKWLEKFIHNSALHCHKDDHVHSFRNDRSLFRPEVGIQINLISPEEQIHIHYLTMHKSYSGGWGVDPYLISSLEIQNDTIFLNEQIQISFQEERRINTLRGQICSSSVRDRATTSWRRSEDEISPTTTTITEPCPSKQR